MIYFQIAMLVGIAIIVGSMLAPKYAAWKAAKAAAVKPAASTDMVTYSSPLVGELVDPDPIKKLQNALKLVACYVACEIDDPKDLAKAIEAYHTLKNISLSKTTPSGRSDKVTDEQARILAAVSAYNDPDKITAVG